MNDTYYIVERVPCDMLQTVEYDRKKKWERPWYCHMKGYDRIPVFGSIGSKVHAESICRKMNTDGRVHYK